MSRRDDRDSDSRHRHHRSKSDREPRSFILEYCISRDRVRSPTPKRPRRDGKPASERPAPHLNSDAKENADVDQTRRRSLKDALPLEAPSAPEPNAEIRSSNKESDKKASVNTSGTKRLSDQTEASRSRTFVQHNERDNARQASRSFSRREDTDRGSWRDSKDRHNERTVSRTRDNDVQTREEKSLAKGEDDRSRRNDGYLKTEANANAPAKKRSFTEKKIVIDDTSVDKASADPKKSINKDRSTVEGERKEERGKPLGGEKDMSKNPNVNKATTEPKKSVPEESSVRESEKREGRGRPLAGDRDMSKNEPRRADFRPRERYGGGGSYRGRERFTGRQGYRSSDGSTDKWKHDLFHEADQNPSLKNEEEQIAKVEALLAS